MPRKLYEEVPAPKKQRSGPLYEDVGAEAEVPAVNTVQQYGQGDAFGSALAQGLTFGFSDELMARLESLTADTNYHDNWKRAQKELEDKRSQHPGTMLTGELLGAGGTMLIPGVGWGANVLRAGKGLEAAGAAARTIGTEMPMISRLIARATEGAVTGAKVGGLSGLGYGQYSSADPDATPIGKFGLPAVRALQGATEGALTGGLMGGAVMPAVTKVTRPLARLGKEYIAQPLLKALAPLMRVSNQTADEVLENPGLYAGPRQSMKEVGEEAKNRVNEFSRSIDQRKQSAIGLLTDDALMTPVEVKQKVRTAMLESGALYRDKEQKLKSAFGTAFERELKTWSEKIDALAGEKGYLSQKEVSGLLEQMKPYAKFDSRTPAEMAAKQNGYKMAFGKINEKLSGNPEYENAMKPVRSDTEEIEGLRKALGFKKSSTVATKEAGRYELSDGVLGKLRSIRKKEVTDEKLQAFAEKFKDTDLGAMAKRVRNEEALEMKRPGFMTAGASSTAGLPGFFAGLTRDMAGPPAWRSMAVATDPNRSGAFDKLLQRPMANFSTQPILDPYYIGYPLYGMSAEAYKKSQDQKP